MSGFKNIGVNAYFKRYGIKYGLYRSIFLANPIHFITSYDNKKLLYYVKVKKKLEHKYSKYLNIDCTGFYYNDCYINNPIWIYWKQGIENTPQIVKKCINSIIKYADSTVILLDDHNLSEYLTLPNFIIQKNKEGKISDAVFADFIRLALLNHFGGTWIDATVLLTDKLPKYAIESDFFVYRDSLGQIDNPAIFCNWFIHSSPHNQIINGTLNMLYAYWKKENHVIEYLCSYIFMRIAYEKIKMPSIWFPYVNSDYCYQYLNMLDKKYSDKEYEHLINLTSVHKLTYKLKDELSTMKNTFYNKLMSEE